MARLYSLIDDSGRARYFTSLCYRNFINKWSSLPEIALEARHRQLQSILIPFEVDQYLNFAADQRNFDSSESLRSFVADWVLFFSPLPFSIVSLIGICSNRVIPPPISMTSRFGSRSSTRARSSSRTSATPTRPTGAKRHPLFS